MKDKNAPTRDEMSWKDWGGAGSIGSHGGSVTVPWGRIPEPRTELVWGGLTMEDREEASLEDPEKKN